MVTGYNLVEQKDETRDDDTRASGNRAGRGELCCHHSGQRRSKANKAEVGAVGRSLGSCSSGTLN